MKILNLYSGIGGNRKLWGNSHSITAKTKEMAENKSCPSYNCGFCETAPLTESAKCSELPKCKWKHYVFGGGLHSGRTTQERKGK